jgi:uncharacterized membrane protein
VNRKSKLIRRTSRNLLWAFVVILIALAIGMMGYSYFGGMDFWKSFANAAMILSGMGPLDTTSLNTPMGEFFEGAYALLSGLLFFAVAGYALAPALHHVLRDFHLQDNDEEPKAKLPSKH